MKFLPYATFTLQTALDPEQIVSRLQPYVTPHSFFSFLQPGVGNYKGELNRLGFKLERRIRYRNSFNPILVGNIIRMKDGSTYIEITMRMRYFVTGFILFWMCTPFLILLYLFGNMFGGEMPSGISLSTSLGMLAVGYLLPTIPFNFEYRHSKNFLMDLFEAEEIDVKSQRSDYRDYRRGIN